MDNGTLALIAPMIAAAISALFWALIRDKDKQIADQNTRIAKLEAEVTKLNDIIDRNTSALTTSALSQEQVVKMLGDLLDDPSKIGNVKPKA